MAVWKQRLSAVFEMKPCLGFLALVLWLLLLRHVCVLHRMRRDALRAAAEGFGCNLAKAYVIHYGMRALHT